MIYIVDNGKSREDHELYFIESTYASTEEVSALLLAFYRSVRAPNASIIGMTDHIKWMNGRETNQLHERVAPGSFFIHPYDADPDETISVRIGSSADKHGQYLRSLDRKLFEAVPRRLLIALIDIWTVGGTREIRTKSGSIVQISYEPFLSALKKACAPCMHPDCMESSALAAICAVTPVMPYTDPSLKKESA